MIGVDEQVFCRHASKVIKFLFVVSDMVNKKGGNMKVLK